MKRGSEWNFKVFSKHSEVCLSQSFVFFFLTLNLYIKKSKSRDKCEQSCPSCSDIFPVAS